MSAESKIFVGPLNYYRTDDEGIDGFTKSLITTSGQMNDQGIIDHDLVSKMSGAAIDAITLYSADRQSERGGGTSVYVVPKGADKFEAFMQAHGFFREKKPTLRERLSSFIFRRKG